MATKQRSRARRSNQSRDRGPRYVAPVLDPNWQSPYAPSLAEKHANQKVVRSFALRKKMPQTILVGIISLALIVGVVAVAWLPVVGVLLMEKVGLRAPAVPCTKWAIETPSATALTYDAVCEIVKLELMVTVPGLPSNPSAVM